MIKTILWDFDGVILDSMKIKGDGFLELLKQYDVNKVNKLEAYHYLNGGISRFEKIRYFYNEILNETITEEEILNLANKFAVIIEQNIYNDENLISDSIKFIKKNYEKYNFHIVSGAVDLELKRICKYFNLNKFFISINGSPTKKDILVKNIIKKYNYEEKETILIGDSINDYNAAIVNSIVFYGFNNLSLSKYNYIHSFNEFLK
jgi:phosphoglycolate phosphatase-like HAD superfamily hydrolase